MWTGVMLKSVVRPLRGFTTFAPTPSFLQHLLGNGDRREVLSLLGIRGGGGVGGVVLTDAPRRGAAGGGGSSTTTGTSSPQRGTCSTTPPPSKEDSLQDHPSRVQFDAKVETGINQQIQVELNASYYYTALAASFGRVDVALRGLERFFWRAARQERNDALNLAHFQNKRGGIVKLQSIEEPGSAAHTTSAKEALTNSLQLQRNLTQQLLNLHKIAEDCNDPVTCDFISEHFLLKQVKRLSRNGRYITLLCRMGDSGLAVHDFDEWLYRDLPADADVTSSLLIKHDSEEPQKP